MNQRSLLLLGAMQGDFATSIFGCAHSFVPHKSLDLALTLEPSRVVLHSLLAFGIRIAADL
jgi:hypothetical protein